MQPTKQSEDSYFKGRGAQVKPKNRYLQHEYIAEHLEGIDAPLISSPSTQVYEEHPKKILNKVTSPDLGMEYSMNPYQGCEHGCIYCYARNTHTYWGFNAGLDFESKIIAKPTAPELLEKELRKSKHVAQSIMLSGNTDCYQPLERKMQITRRMLQVLLKYKHPVSIITKNALILRDIDLLTEMSSMKLVNVTISITTLDEKMRLLMEPRTAAAKRRLDVVQMLSAKGIPVNINVSPIIPSINSEEIPSILEASANAGALTAHYGMVRLNGDVGIVFKDWIYKNLPDRAEKVLNQVASMHGGQLGDSRFGIRMKGEGEFASSIRRLFELSKARYFAGRVFPALDYTLFDNSEPKAQLSLF